MASKDDNTNENLFKIMDGIILQLNRTKKLFIVMIISIMVLSPTALLITYFIFTSPFEPEEHFRATRGLHMFFPELRWLPLAITLVWLGIGVRQWFVLSKWTKKYDRYKELQEEIDKKLSEEEKDDDQPSPSS